MTHNIVTDGLAAMAVGVAVVAAAFLFTGKPANDKDSIYYQASWAEPAAPQPSLLPNAGG